jgi:hypothetical protein
MTLTSDTLDRIHRTFPEAAWTEVETLLREECGDRLPLVRSAELVERIRFAVLKLSCGDLDRLKRHIRGARHDWRDVLMAAGFANSITSHKEWMP